MPLTPHAERHFTSGDAIRDIVIGMSDGLTVPFALAAGLSGAVQSTSIRAPCLSEAPCRQCWSAASRPPPPPASPVSLRDDVFRREEPVPLGE